MCDMHEFMKITSGTPPLCVMRSLTLDEGGSQLDKSQAIKARKLKHTAKLLFADDSCNTYATGSMSRKTGMSVREDLSCDNPAVSRDI